MTVGFLTGVFGRFATRLPRSLNLVLDELYSGPVQVAPQNGVTPAEQAQPENQRKDRNRHS